MFAKTLLYKSMLSAVVLLRLTEPVRILDSLS